MTMHSKVETKELYIEDQIDHKSTDADFATQYSKGLVVVTDDPSTPALTIRAVLLGIIWAIFLATGNTVASFRDNSFVIPTNLASIVSYPMGIFMAAVLPKGILNPGPFSVKEHVLVYIIAGSAGGKPYGINNVIGQKLFFNDSSVNIWNGLAWVFVSQMVGYGVAGLLRRFLVKPTAMLWPAALGNVAFFNAFHDATSLDDPNGKYVNSISRYSCFWLAFFVMFVYSWFPVYFAPVLSMISVICLITKNRTWRFLGSGSINQGPGIMSLTFDWTKINYTGAVYFPWYTSMNFLIGAIFWGWIIGPIWHFTNAFGRPNIQSTMNYGGGMILNSTAWKNSTIAYDPIPRYNSVGLYDVNGYQLKVAQGISWPFLLDSSNNLNPDAYEQAGGHVYLTAAFTLTYFCSFISLGAVFSQVFLWYGKDIYRQFKDAMAQNNSDLDNRDPHYKIMKSYPEISELVYLTFFAFMIIMSIIVCEYTPFFMQWWVTILCIVVSCIFTVPIGIIQAITGYQPGLNILTQVIAGLMLPGQTVSVMAFKCLGYDIVIQSLNLIGDLKLDMHIPPLAMVFCQLLGTFIGVIFNTVVALMICDSSLLTSAGFSGNNYFTFANAGGIWGAIGPARFFGPSSPYWSLNLGYIIGFLLPFIPWALNIAFPSKYWRKINVVLLSASAVTMVTGSDMVYIVTPTIAAFYFQFYLYRYHRQFWDKYAWIIANAFDSAAALVALAPPVLSISNFAPPEGPLAPLAASGGNDYYCYGVDWQGNNSEMKSSLAQ